MFSQVEIKKDQKDNLAISMEAHMLPLPMDPEHLDFLESLMESLLLKSISICADK